MSHDAWLAVTFIAAFAGLGFANWQMWGHPRNHGLVVLAALPFSTVATVGAVALALTCC